MYNLKSIDKFNDSPITTRRDDVSDDDEGDNFFQSLKCLLVKKKIISLRYQKKKPLISLNNKNYLKCQRYF